MTVRYDAYVLDKWWHTASICSHLYNLQALYYNANSKKGATKIQPRPARDFHPYVKPSTSGKATITKENFSILKTIGNALCGGALKPG